MFIMENFILLLFTIPILLVYCRAPPNGITVDKLEIWSEIQSRFAVTDVLAQMSNSGSRDQEVKFSMDIPYRAFITQFHMVVDGRRIDAQVKERNFARDAYEEARRRDQNAGLVEQSSARSTSTFEILTNLAPRSQVNFNLTYQEVLERVHGVYKHIINVRPDYDIESLTINVLIAERERITRLHTPKFKRNTGQMTNEQLLQQTEDPSIKSQSMAENGGSLTYVYYDGNGWGRSPDGQMVILYDVERNFDGGQLETLDGYFVHFIAPDGLEIGDRDVVFAIDTSGSMLNRKIEQVKSALRQVINDLHSGDRFDIITFSTRVSSWQNNLVPATTRNKQAAIAFIDSIVAGGGTNINDALVQSLQELHLATGRQPLASIVILLTDGLPTVGEKDPDKILRNARAIATQNIEIIHAIAFGDDADYEWLKRTASQHGGVARKIYTDSDADIQLEGFYDEISSPILTDVDVKYLNGNVKPDSLTIVNKGKTLNDDGEIIIVGKTTTKAYENMQATVEGMAADGKVKVLQSDSFVNNHPISPCFVRPQLAATAKIPDARHIDMCPVMQETVGFDPSRFRGKRQAPVTTAIGYIERTWAYLTIDRLIKQSHDMSSTNRSQNEKQALTLSLKYNFVTPLTSLVVVDDATESIKLDRWDDAVRGRNQSQPLDDIERVLKPGDIFESLAASSAGPEVACRNLIVILAFDLVISQDVKGRKEIAKQLARDTVYRVRRALPYGNETRFIVITFGADRSKIQFGHQLADDQDSTTIIDAIDESVNGQKTNNNINTLYLFREMVHVNNKKTRLIIFTDGSNSLGVLGGRLGMLRRNPYDANIGVAAIHFDQFNADRYKEYMDIVGFDGERFIYEKTFAAASFDDMIMC